MNKTNDCIIDWHLHQLKMPKIDLYDKFIDVNELFKPKLSKQELQKENLDLYNEIQSNGLMDKLYPNKD